MPGEDIVTTFSFFYLGPQTKLCDSFSHVPFKFEPEGTEMVTFQKACQKSSEMRVKEVM